MMAKSRLSCKLFICDLIQQLDETSCLDVIRSISTDLGCDNLNALLTKIILTLCETTTSDTLINITNTIKRIMINLNNNKTNNVEQHNNKNHKTNNTKKHSTLNRLPFDLIAKTSLFLNDKDVYNFEQCCRLFYQVINNLSFANQSNAFKTFNLTPTKLDHMTNSKCSFYKYSKAEILTLNLDIAHSDRLEMFIEQFETRWEKVQMVNTYDEWLTNMFKSIKVLNLDKNATVILYTLPLFILFDASESQLEKIILRHDWQCEDPFGWETYIKKFEKLYLECEDNLIKQGKELKVLKCVQHILDCNYYRFEFLLMRCIKSNHLWLLNMGINLSNLHVISINIPYLRMVTLENNSCLQITSIRNYNGSNPRISTNLNNDDNKNNNNNNTNYNSNIPIAIETIRLINCSHHDKYKFLSNEKMIESLNLHNSLKNLTMHMCFNVEYQRLKQGFSRCITNILTKKYFFNLVNVNILFDFRGGMINESTVNEFVDWIFDIFKKNEKILIHQFGQLNIGYRVYDKSECELLQSNVMKWNSNMNDKILMDYQTKWKTFNLSTVELETNDRQFAELKQQWT